LSSGIQYSKEFCHIINNLTMNWYITYNNDKKPEIVEDCGYVIHITVDCIYITVEGKSQAFHNVGTIEPYYFNEG